MSPSFLFAPTLSSLVKSQQTCLVITGFAVTHLTLVVTGLPSWQCPIRYGLGIPCPGCGLSRAMIALLQHNFQDAILIHAFSPLALAIMVLITISGLLPQSLRLSLSSSIEITEIKLGITNLMLIAFFVYWLVRLFLFPKLLYSLVM